MVKVTVCGAAGGIGQPLSMLLKLNTEVTELSLFDVVNAKGVAADLSHICTPAKVTGFQPSGKEDTETIKKALANSDLVVIPAGVPRKPGMTRADLFNINASIIRDITASVGKACPDAAVLIISNPVNSTVPIAAEVLKKLGVFNPRKLFGVTTLDSVRAETFLGDLIGETPTSLRGKISVVGGHSGDTIVPLLDATPDVAQKVSKLSKDQYDAFIKRVQFGGDEVVKAKDGAGSATLSMAYAGYRFAEQVINSMKGRVSNAEIPDSSFIYLPGIPKGEQLASKHLNNCLFFSLPVILKNGQIDSFINPFDELNVNSGESKLVDVALQGLQKSIDQGISFVTGSKL